MRTFFEKVMPRYSRIPLLMVLIINILVYYFSRLININLEHHSLEIWIDRELPFLPEFIVIYVLAYVQWIVGYIVISRESRKSCYKYMSAEIVAKLICCVFYIFYPTAIARPEITDGGIFNWMTSLIFAFDPANNLFPSVHCLASYLCFRGAISAKKVGLSYKIVNLVFAILVFLSTVFVKQHFFVDIFGGIIVVEVGILLVRLFKIDRIFIKINQTASKIRGGNYYE